MKTGELAKILNLDPKTIRNWIDNYGLEKLFSPSARGIDGNTQRILMEADVLILNTIHRLRAQNVNDWNEIKAHLESGDREREFPGNAIDAERRMIPIETLEQSAMALTTLRERDAALVQIKQLEAELSAERKRIEELLREAGDIERLREEVAAERKENSKRIEELVREMGELREKIGRLQGKLEFYQEDKQRRKVKEDPRNDL
jgi:DNA-binding transcriptional MerR regulator